MSVETTTGLHERLLHVGARGPALLKTTVSPEVKVRVQEVAEEYKATQADVVRTAIQMMLDLLPKR